MTADSGGPGSAATGTETVPPAAGAPPVPGTAGGTPPGLARRAAGWLQGRAAAAHLILLACYTGAGVLVTWPSASSLGSGRLIKVPDVSSYVWALWWVAHQAAHLGDPWFTRYMAAPAGIQLGFDTLMPLPGLIMSPVTLLAGPVASFAVLTILTPGLLCYLAYRAARLWLGQPGSIAAGAFFGLSTMLTWQDLYHLNIAMGTLFLPLTLEAAVRLRRSPGRRQAIIAGLVLGASVLTNQESAVVAVLLAVAVLAPWLAGQLRRVIADRHDAGAIAALRSLGLGVIVATAAASPQLAAMIRQVAEGGAAVAASQLTQTYRDYGAGLPALFAPSPRLGHFHLLRLAAAYQFSQPSEGVPTFGVVLSALALAGLALTWRRRPSRGLAGLWLAGAVLALGPTLVIGGRTSIPLADRWHGVTVSLLMPYTWLVRVPGLSALREADRLALLGLLGAAILAGTAVQWVCQHARPVIAGAAVVVIAAAGALEAGWSGSAAKTMPATLPQVDRAIAADPSGSIVVDVPFGLRGGVGLTGFRMQPEALVLATEDGHPRAESYTSWVPQPTKAGILRDPFYYCLYGAQNGIRHSCDATQAAAARRRLASDPKISWVIVWHSRKRAARPSVISYLDAMGFSIDYRVNTPDTGISVWHRR